MSLIKKAKTLFNNNTTDLIDKEKPQVEVSLPEDHSIRDIVRAMPEHGKMLTEIQAILPEVHRAKSLFGKTQSQFMDNMMTVSHPTTYRNIRQVLAEIEKATLALKEAYFKNRKKEIEIEIKLRSLETEEDDLRREYIGIEIDELRTQLETSQTYISGAIRKVRNYTEQYEALKKKAMEEHGVEDFNEIDFELEEERYHIMKAFEQGLCAARANGGRIDEGNYIYLQQIGINGAAAQEYISLYLLDEQALLNKKVAPGHGAVLEFLSQMADKFTGCSTDYANHKGMSVKTDQALLTKGDTRLISKDEE